MTKSSSNPTVNNTLIDPKYKDFYISLYGEEEYNALKTLTDESQKPKTRKKSNKTVFLLHGITGASLGDPNQLLDPFDIIWIGPTRIIGGDLKHLNYPDTEKKPIVTHGFLPFGYNRFCSTLRKQFNIVEHAYDWRKPLEQLGLEFSKILEACPDKDITVVAHSMGGLVMRAALDNKVRKFPNLKRVITLGTPHHGSFAPVQAIRGTNKLVRKMARLIPGQTAEDIARDALGTMPGFYDLLPFFGAEHLYDANSWPTSGPQPNQMLLDQAQAYHKKIAGIDDRFSVIIGGGRETIVGAELSQSTDQFEFSFSNHGDGTVPFNHAHPDNLVSGQVYYTDSEHGAMQGNKKVLKAIIDLVNDKPVTSLSRNQPSRRTVSLRGQIGKKTEIELSKEADIELSQYDDHSPQSLISAMSDYIRIDEPEDLELNEDAEQKVRTSIPEVSPTKSKDIDLQALTYYLGGERERRPFELNLFSGDIRNADCRAYAFGIYEGIPPGGAGLVLDRAVDGQINEMFERGMLDARIGGVSILPVARRRVRAEFIVTVGLGLPDGSEDAIASATQNLVRYLIKTRAEDCALVLMGSKSGLSSEVSLRGMLTGCFRALADEPDSDMFRGLTVCELDPDNFLELQTVAPDAAREAADRVKDVRLTLHQKTIIGLNAEDNRRSLVAEKPLDYKKSVFITAKLEKFSNKEYELKLNILGDEALASTHEISHFFSVGEFNKLTSRIRDGSPPSSREAMNELGENLANLIFTDEVQEVFNALGKEPMVVQQNPLATRIPWEILPTKSGRFPCLEGGLSRHLLVQADSVSKYMNQRRYRDGNLTVLIIGDPTSDLPGALKEAKAIHEGLRKLVGDRYIDFLQGEAATKSRILDVLRSGKYDMLHYAGHAAYKEDERWRSGIKCSGGDILTGRDLAQLSQLPAVMVFNACQSAKVRRAQRKQKSDFQGSFAEAAILSGISHYVGTYWEVNDYDAVSFATTFYKEMSDGEMIGAALVKARQAVRDRAPTTVDWLNYIHYGNRLFRMKIKGEGTSIK